MEGYLFSNFEKVHVSQKSDLAAEQKFLEHAYDRLESMRRSAQEMMNSALETPRGGTHQARAERDMIVRRSLSRLEQLEIGDQALSFGGIDFNGEIGEVVSFHIGRLAVADDDLDPLVIDWRAPVAEPFYRATGKNPMDLARRRHFNVSHRMITAIEDEIFDPQEFADSLESDVTNTNVSGPNSLYAAVTKARTGRMVDIVATIQSQQDEVIRAPLSEMLVVQGGPGTGKTAVALHRAAYLLYTHRLRLERQGVLVVAPSRIFARYIDHVLPSLGETGVEILTIESLAGFGESTRVDSPFQEALKGDLRMATVIAKAIKDRQRPLKHDEQLTYGGFNLIMSPGDTIEAIRIARRRSGSHNQRRKFVESFLAVRIAEKYLAKKESFARDDSSESEIESVVWDSDSDTSVRTENDAIREASRKIKKDPNFQRIIQRIWPKLTPETFLGDLFSHLPLIRLAGKDVLSPKECALLHRSSIDSEKIDTWSRSDLVLLNEARTHLGSYYKKAKDKEEDRGYGHVIIDEAQDLSPMTARMIGRYSLAGSMTIVGDVAQSTSPFGLRTWQEIVAPFPRTKEMNIVELGVNYRTPHEVMKIANGILKEFAPNLVPAESIRYSEQPVEIVQVGSGSFEKILVDTIRREMSNVHPGIVALIAPHDQKESLKKDLANAGLPVSSDIDESLTVLSINEAKGLEFDSVIIVGANRLLVSDKTNLQALFVATTRTTVRLVFLDNKDLPDVVVDLVSRSN